MKKRKNIGSSFEDFLKNEGIQEEVNVAAVKSVITRHLIAYDPLKKLTDETFIGKAILECLVNNDPEGVMEMIEIYLNALEKIGIS
jgi:hypothetical protein